MVSFLLETPSILNTWQFNNTNKQGKGRGISKECIAPIATNRKLNESREVSRNKVQTPGIIIIMLSTTDRNRDKKRWKGLIVGLAWATIDPSFRALFLPDIVLDRAGVLVAALTHFAAVEVLESGSEWPVHVVVLSGEPVLSVIAERVEFVAPVSVEIEPFGWGVGAGG